MSNDESDWNEEIDDLPIDSNDEKEYEDKFQCRVCFNMFSEKTELMSHIEIHTEQFALDFIKEYQPVSGNMILKKFKNLNLVELEKKGLIKFFDKFMGWCLPNYIVKNTKNLETKFNSIINAPCFTCQYEKVCEISNEKINPLNCQWIDDWVNGKFTPEKDTIKKSENHMETLMQAKLFCAKSKKFDIIGKFEKNEIQNSPNKFTLTDKEDCKMDIVLTLEDEKKIEIGKNMIVKNVKLIGNPHGMAIDATKVDTKIQRI